MEDLNTVKMWENSLRQEIENLKACKDNALNDSSIPKSVKDRFIDVLRSLKMSMIQVMSKCSQLRSEQLTSKALKVRIEKVKFEYDEVKKSLSQLLKTVEPRVKTCRSSSGVFQQPSYVETPSVVTKELEDICGILQKAQEQLEDHRHSEYEQRIEILEAENQELRRTLARIKNDNSEVYELVNILKGRIERIESNEEREQDKPQIPKRRVLLQPSSHAEALIRNNY